uniref:Ig-like domain-containing protein n=1 Tax=Haplochromis burtoni TaxID=8153 RepID=A0A3Q2VFE9_HAPBU
MSILFNDKVSFISIHLNYTCHLSNLCSSNNNHPPPLWPEFLGGTFAFDYVGVNKTPHITTKQEPGTFILEITEVNQSDTGLYYCIKVKLLAMTFLKGTFLRIKEPTISDTIQVFPSDHVHPGNPVTLQCSVLSNSENKTCPRNHSVFWFNVRSDKSQPNVIYPNENSDKCEKIQEASSTQKCVYSFSKNVSSSDAGSYYCAVATCGQIIFVFGNGTKQEMGMTMKYIISDIYSSLLESLLRSIICLVISLILNVIFICCRTPGAACEQIKSELNYAALQFSGRKTTRGKKKKGELETEESVYSQVKCRM